MASSPRWYRALLLLLPPAFRKAYGAEMERLFAERWADTGRGLARVRLTVEAVADVVAGAVAEWSVGWMEERATSTREGWGMDGWIQDLRIGVRGLMRRPGFTAAAVLTLALGIGATVAIFSVVNGVLLEPLPYPDADRLVVLWETDTRTGRRNGGVDHPDIRTWQRDVPGLTVAGYSGSRPTLTGMGDPEVIFGAQVTDGLLGVFGLAPVLGRDLTAADDVLGGPRVLVISHGFWQARLGGSPDVLGRTLTLGGNPWEIVGVTPEGFDFPEGAALWVPRRHDPEGCGHGCRIMGAVGRIQADATLAQVQERMDAVSARLAEEFPDAHRDSGITFERLLDTQVSDVRTALWVLMAAVVMVLLIACANVANLLLVRSAERTGEMALRATLGASRTRLVRQLLTESLVLAGVAGLLGVGLAHWGISALVALAPDGIPRLAEAGLDGRVLAFGLATVGLVTMVFGLAPTLQLARRPLAPILGGSRRTRGGRTSNLSRSLLLSGEVALSLVLLLGAGLLFGTLRQIRGADLGFDAERVERFRLSVPESRYDTQGIIRFFEELEGRLAAIPGVDAAGAAFGAPLASGNIGTSVEFLDREAVDPADRPSLAVRPATLGYPAAMGLPLVRGRWFEPADVHGSEGVVVINQAAAAAHWPGEDPLGKRIRLSVSWGFDDDPARTVVGVVGNVRSYSATEPDRPTAYLPNAQFGVNSMYVTLRLSRGTRSVMPAAREAVAALDPNLALHDVARMEDVVDGQLAATRFYLALLGVFSALALILASVGLYGVVAYAVSRRTREIGIRVALGAPADSVVGMVIREGMAPALVGVLVGLSGAVFAGRALSSLLYGVEPNDPTTVAAVTALLLAVTSAATLVPARRASRIAPATALREE